MADYFTIACHGETFTLRSEKYNFNKNQAMFNNHPWERCDPVPAQRSAVINVALNGSLIPIRPGWL